MNLINNEKCLFEYKNWQDSICVDFENFSYQEFSIFESEVLAPQTIIITIVMLQNCHGSDLNKLFIIAITLYISHKSSQTKNDNVMT